MVLSQDEAAKVASKLLSSFNSNHMVLFVGRNINDNDITDEIKKLPWSCVVTSRTDEGFSSLFSTQDRTPREYCTFSDIPSRPLDRSKLPILRLFGIGKPEDDALASLGLVNTRNDPNSWDMLSVLPGMLDCINQMIIIGYTPDHPDEVLTDYIVRKFFNIPEGNVNFFGMETNKSDSVIKLAEMKHFGYYNDSLSEILATFLYKNGTQVLLNYNEIQTDNIFYSKGEAISFPDHALHQTRHFVTLLTEEKLYSFRPMGRIQQSEWFSNFLKYSSTEGPQWYGYLRNSTFYLKRDFEDKLVNLVEGLLEGASPMSEISNMPVILQGDPGSSKSITLGALAFSIYEKHQFPVLYIKDEYLTLSSGSEELEALNMLMSDIQKKGSNNKILIVWDCSSHRNVINYVRNLARELENWGRRFVLLCSSYNLPEYLNQETFYYNLMIKSDNNKINYEFTKSDIYRYDFKIKDKFFVVEAKREMTEKEIIQLKQIFKLYSGISPTTLNSWWEHLKEDAKNDIFYYFYKLISLIRPNLEEGLTKEQKKIKNYVQKQLNRIEAGYEKDKVNTQVNLFEAAGFDPSEFGLLADELEGDEEEMFDLERFNICIALFSKFKISTPYSLAMHMLCRSGNGNQSIYSTANRELFRLVTNEIPWIRYGGNINNEDFTFSFRNSLEAEIFLRENNVSEDKQIDIICELIRLYGENYKINKYIDVNFSSNLQMLLRLIGPNSSYRNFQKGGSENENHQRILKLFNRIIEQIQQLRTKYSIPDQDGSFVNLEVTFMREFYGAKWDVIQDYFKERNEQKPWEFSAEIYSKENYEKRMEMLQTAVNIAIDKIEFLERRMVSAGTVSEKRHLGETRNALVVEMVYCNLNAEEIQKEYLELCSAKMLKTEQAWSSVRFILPYRDIFKRMMQVINTDPTNGYSYNALFRLFLREYDRPTLSAKEKLQYLSEINMIIDMINSDDDMEIFNRGANGADELGSNMSRIKDLSGKYRITISDIERRTGRNNSFYDLFDQMKEVNNPSAILFVCRQELENENLLKITEPLNDEQVECCNRVYDFMRKEDNEKCIENNQFALSLLLRVAWMKYNKQPMFSAKECNLTYMNPKEWNLIEQICSMYIQCAGENALPSIMLIYALATLHTNGYIDSNKILERIHEGGFYTATRMRVPYMLCDEYGTPMLFNGRVLSTNGYNGFIKVNGIPQNIGSNVGIRFYMRNLGRSVMPKNSDVLQNLEIGIGYTGFSVYTKEGRLRKVDKQ